MLFDWRERALSMLQGIKMIPDFPMSELTTFKIGGPVDLLIEPENIEQLIQTVQFCKAEHVVWMVVGLGSNLLVRDKGIRGIAIKLSGEFAEWKIEGIKVSSGAAVSLSELAKATACAGLSGLEFACGIPGTVGGAVYMNAGAYDGEISQVLTKAMVFDLQEGLIEYNKLDFDFGYRHSRFQAVEQIILRAEFELEAVAPESAQGRVAELTCKRESKQPLELPSAGSVFRRPEGYYVGPLLEQAGLKGYTIGGAQVSNKHAGFIVNIGGATAQDVLDLISHIQRTIKEQYGVDLVPEVRVVGEE